MKYIIILIILTIMLSLQNSCITLQTQDCNCDTVKVDTIIRDSLVINSIDSIIPRDSFVFHFDTSSYINYFGHELFKNSVTDTSSPYKVISTNYSDKVDSTSYSITFDIINIGESFQSIGYLGKSFKGIAYDLQVYLENGERVYTETRIFNKDFRLFETYHFQTVFPLQPYTKKQLENTSFTFKVYYNSFDNLFIYDSIVTYKVFDTLIIEAEDYTSFYDLDFVNEGGHYRADGVDIIPIQNGYAIGYFRQNEWLSYDLNLDPGLYKFCLSAATGLEDMKLQLSLNNAPIHQFNIDKLGWYLFYDYCAEIELTGNDVLKITNLTGDVNFDKIEIIKK